MIIYPTQREKIVRKDPEGGIYRALLSDVYRYTTRKGTPGIRITWELLSHPNQNYIWQGLQFFGLKNPGLLAKMLYDWKRQRSEFDPASGNRGVPYPEMFLNHEADLAVLTPPEEGALPINVEKVFPPGDLLTKTEFGTFELVSNHPFLRYIS